MQKQKDKRTRDQRPCQGASEVQNNTTNACVTALQQRTKCVVTINSSDTPNAHAITANINSAPNVSLQQTTMKNAKRPTQNHKRSTQQKKRSTQQDKRSTQQHKRPTQHQTHVSAETKQTVCEHLKLSSRFVWKKKPF